MSTHAIAVAVGILRLADGRILLCQRPEGKSYALQWEFPGGKLEPGESSREALRRELMEELAIEAEIGALLHEQVAHYRDGGTFAVGYYLIEQWHGELINRNFADMRWLAPEELPEFDVLDGNRQFCARLATEGLPPAVPDAGQGKA